MISRHHVSFAAQRYCNVSYDNTVRKCYSGLFTDPDSQDISYIDNNMFILQSLNIVR